MNLIHAFLMPLSLAASPAAVEVPLLKAFVPPQGYDSNDNTEIVLDGDLPDPCYTLGAAKAEALPGGRGFRVKQMAWRRTDGNCGSGDLIDSPVPFTTSVSLGRLEPGSYAVEYRTERGHPQRAFTVSPALLDAQDDYPYAALSGVSVPEALKETENAVIELRGVYTSTCSSRELEVRVKRLDDVFVILPIQHKDDRADCKPAKIPFRKEVDLGRVERGHYLVHARSMNGKALFQSFFSYKEYETTP